MKKIILTGGGSAGHVTPNLALIPELEKRGWEIEYIGTHNGIERKLIADRVPYHSISAGKLRRYFDFKNFTDPFRVLKGIMDAYMILRKQRPRVVFSKGGFVSLPVAVAAKTLGIPVILHESDFTPGLANKLALPFSTHLCLTFPETLQYVPKEKATLTGNPIRQSLFIGDKTRGKKITGFTASKPVVLVMGGSLGAVKINSVLREALPNLLKHYQIVHICGQGNLDPSSDAIGYQQFEYIDQELPDIFALADLIISRAGANVLYELLALQKPHLLIPLSHAASRGDQVLNANSFKEQGFSMVLTEDELNSDSLISALKQLENESGRFIRAMQATKLKDAVKSVITVIEKTEEKIKTSPK